MEIEWSKITREYWKEIRSQKLFADPALHDFFHLRFSILKYDDRRGYEVFLHFSQLEFIGDRYLWRQKYKTLQQAQCGCEGFLNKIQRALIKWNPIY